MFSLELVAVVFTLVAVYLTTRQIIWCWPLALISVTLTMASGQHQMIWRAVR